jgi:hypothetical protein
LSVAVMVAVPAFTAVTVNVALDEPAGTITGVWTVATAELLLDSTILAPPAAAADVRVTVASPLPPAATIVALSETPDTVGSPVEGPIGEPEPPH